MHYIPLDNLFNDIDKLSTSVIGLFSLIVSRFVRHLSNVNVSITMSVSTTETTCGSGQGFLLFIKASHMARFSNKKNITHKKCFITFCCNQKMG